MVVEQRMHAYLKLVRPYGMHLLGFIPVFTAIVNGTYDVLHLAILLVIGCFVHIFAFAQNDYYDVDVDRSSRYVANRPLASGSISRNTVIGIVLFSFFFTIILTIVFFFQQVYSLLVLVLTFFLMTLYNKYSKHISGMEYILGVSIFTFGIFGALTVSINISILAIIISFVGCLQWLFSVGISANIKDVEYDAKLGIRTTPMMFGVRVVDAQLVIPASFHVYAWGVKVLHILIAVLPFFLAYTSLNVNGLPIPVVCFLIISVLLLYMTMKILSIPLAHRDTLLRYEGVQEGIGFLLVPIVLMSYLIEKFGILSTLLLFLVLIMWPLFSLRLFFGKRLIPLE